MHLVKLSGGEVIPDPVRKAATTAFRALAGLQTTALTEIGFPPGKELPNRVDITWTPDMSKEEFTEKTFLSYKVAVADNAAIENGHLFCYNCQRSDCEHSMPKTDTHVFAGYQDTGRPLWSEFFNYLLSLDDNRVDLLFADSPIVLAHMVGRKPLIKHQLLSYGRASMTYRVIGQVVAGYLKIGQEKFALTAQVVENRSRILKFQVITSERGRERFADFAGDERSSHRRVFDALNQTRHRIERLNNRWSEIVKKTDRSQFLSEIFSLLRHLANSIERKGRQKHRRTSHAEKRLHQERPIHKAYDDLASAGPQRFFQDNVTRSIVVLGKNGRSHVFSREGRHITSLTVTGEKLDQRRKRNRYQPLSSEQIQTFRSTIQATST